MNPFFLLQEKLKQRHLRAELERSKAITQAAARREAETPLLDAIAQAARSAGKSGDEVLAEFVAGKASFPGIESALAAARKSAAPAPAKAAAASTPTKSTPAKTTATPHLDRLATLKGAKKSEFYQKHRDEIFSEHHHITSKH